MKNKLLYNKETGEIIAANSRPLTERFKNLRQVNNLEVLSHSTENYLRNASRQLTYLLSFLEGNKKLESYRSELEGLQSSIEEFKTRLQNEVRGELNGILEARNTNRNFRTR